MTGCFQEEKVTFPKALTRNWYRCSVLRNEGSKNILSQNPQQQTTILRMGKGSWGGLLPRGCVHHSCDQQKGHTIILGDNTYHTHKYKWDATANILGNNFI